MFLVAVTGLEIVIIYVQTFDGSYIIGILFTTSVLKFIGVIWWFMHLRWDKILNTILFLMGLVIAVFTFFAVIYMGDTHPIIDQFEVTTLKNEWKAKNDYTKGGYVKVGDAYFQANPSAHLRCHSLAKTKNFGSKVEGIPHQIIMEDITQADTVEIHSEKPGNSLLPSVFPRRKKQRVEGTQISLLAQSATTDDFRIKVRSEAYWTENR